MLRGRQPLEKLDDARVPAGHILRKLLERGNRALAPTVADGVRHLRARAADAGHLATQIVQRAVADQIADVRRDPVRASFDEMVVVTLLQIFLYHGHLFGDDRQQRAQGLALFHVADTRDRGQQTVNFFEIETHGITPVHPVVQRSASAVPPPKRCDSNPRSRAAARRRRAGRAGPARRDRRSDTGGSRPPPRRRDALRQGHDLAQRNGLAERARVERKRGAQRLFDDG